LKFGGLISMRVVVAALAMLFSFCRGSLPRR
jgi:hypothetical protein